MTILIRPELNVSVDSLPVSLAGKMEYYKGKPWNYICFAYHCISKNITLQHASDCRLQYLSSNSQGFLKTGPMKLISYNLGTITYYAIHWPLEVAEAVGWGLAAGSRSRPWGWRGHCCTWSRGTGTAVPGPTIHQRCTSEGRR